MKYDTFIALVNQILKTIKNTEEEPPKVVKYWVFASRFVYEVNQGGFAQLFYNLQGTYLKDMEKMLLYFKATKAHQFYKQSIQVLLDDVETYHAFLQSDYQTDNTAKSKLHLVTIDYFEEIENVFDGFKTELQVALPEVNNWLKKN